MPKHGLIHSGLLLVATLGFLALGMKATDDKKNGTEQVSTFSAGNVASSTLPGVNIAGGAFGRVPGRLNQDYIYPDLEILEEIARMGFRIVRIPFRWERLQPQMMGELSTQDRDLLKQAVLHATGLGLIVVLDMHNYARRREDGKNYLVGSHEVPAAALADAWIKISQDYKDNGDVWLGLMNEPHGIDAKDWWAIAQTVTVSMRDTGVENKILVPGIAWSSARSWVSSSNSQFAEQFADPANNFAFEIHQYLDLDASGRSGTCFPQSTNRIDDVIRWAEKTNSELFFGEVGAGAGSTCQREYPALLAAIDASPNVIGWTAWAAGRWWPRDYPLFISMPSDQTTASSHANLLLSYLKDRPAMIR